MKKIITFFVLVFLFGCTVNHEQSTYTNSSHTPEPITESTFNQENNTKIDIKNANIDDLLFFSSYTKTSTFHEMIKNQFKFDLTTLVITKDFSSVAWMFEGSLNDLSSDDVEALTNCSLGKNDHGKYIYVGELTELTDNVFSAKGSFLPSAELVKKPISDNIDFYLVFSDSKIYMCTENLLIDELINYQSDSYFK